MSVESIEDHIAMACDCGSVNFSLLKSKKVECNQCGLVKNIIWTYNIDESEA